MRHKPSGLEFECGPTRWDASSRLIVTAGPEELAPDSPTRPTEIAPGWTLWKGEDLARAKFIERAEFPADECELLSRWPVTCCRPGRRKPSAPGRLA